MADPLDKITVLLPEGATISDVLAAKPVMPFDKDVVEFIAEFGRGLRRDPALRRFPELVALGYWARNSTIERLRQRFETAYPEAVRLPRGIAFHVAPANVDTIFVYSLLLSMLAGNCNLVRVSARGGEQSNRLMASLSAALSSAPPAVKAANAVIRYQRDDAVTDRLSLLADLRIVWGGDDSVRAIRRSPLAPRGVELVFPNRYSAAVFDAKSWMAEEDQAGIARKFVNDTLWFGQMACSSPRAMIWRGNADEVEAASASFWRAMGEAAEEADLPFEPADAVAKLVAEQSLAIRREISILAQAGNRIRAVRDNDPGHLGESALASGGFFVECRVDRLDELAPVVRSDWQSIASFGVSAEDWRAFLTTNRPAGIDRITEIGSALDFNSIWDGEDLLTAMSRITNLEIR